MPAKSVVIENPVINSPFDEPQRHFRFGEDGITDEIILGRRQSEYFVPIASPKKRGQRVLFETEWLEERRKENEFINKVRERVTRWRQGNHVGMTKTTRALLDYWTRDGRDRRLFFCQIEALETAIYLGEIAHKYGDAWIENDLRRAAEDGGSTLYRVAFKMATGSGKTVVMAMLIAWQTLNKLANAQDARFADAFLIVTPGITIRDRLRVLLPSDPDNYYRQLDVVAADLMPELGKAKITITNFHALRQQETTPAGKLTKALLRQGGNDGAFTETPEQMVRRVCRDLGTKRGIVVINDEAHHCYRPRAADEDEDAEKLKGEDRREAEKRREEARVWITGLEAVNAKVGVKTVFDLSATPFYLRGSGYREGTLFPWVVSDFSLIDAIESGIVKVPRVPVADDAMTGEQPMYRELWTRIREGLPKKGRGTEAVKGEPKLPTELEGALQSLYGNYEKAFALWGANAEARERGHTPPVFIVVCNNTNVSKLVFDYIAGWEKTLPDGSAVNVPGKLSLFSNVGADGRWLPRPTTILIDSEQLESGDAMSRDFKQIAAQEIEEFKGEYLRRFPGRSAEELTDEDLLREVLNTVGKIGKLGEQIRCVVSVSMLTEGWDANTVTHILGVRAFGTQLLCEQVVGRGLRRMNYALTHHQVPVGDDVIEVESFATEYAEVYGVPFSFIPCAGSATPTPGPQPTRVRALEERADCEITFPRVVGYRFEHPEERLSATFTDDSTMQLSTQDVPTRTENAPIVGERTIHTLDELRQHREQEIDFLLAKLVLEKYFRQEPNSEAASDPSTHRFDPEVKAWLFPQVLRIAREWREHCLRLKDDVFPQLLLLVELAHRAAERIYSAIVAGTDGARTLKPILKPYDTTGSTRFVDFDTTRAVWPTAPAKCHVNYVVADTGSWEQKLAQSLEDMPEVLRYVKNQSLGFTIPYALDGEERAYVPDFIADLDDGHGVSDPLQLVLEVTGQRRGDKEAKVAAARNLWVPAINNHGGYGRWAFVEITDPWTVKQSIRALIAGPRSSQETA
jgi:type III restriction enzyme